MKISQSKSGRSFLTVLAILYFSATLMGQSTTGTITGTVQDTSGAVMPGASLKLTATGTGIVQVQTSDESGNFRFLLLPPGTYTLEATIAGFKTFRREGLVVQSDRSMAVPVEMSVGEV